jgi:hypothetical protein
MTDSVTAGWSDFAVATAGAAAALAGLVMVAISVNIRAILDLPGVPARAAAAVGSLVLVVVTSLLLLIPGQPVTALGTEVLLATLAALWLHVVSLNQITLQSARPRSARVLSVPLAAAQLLPQAVGGILLVLAADGALAWLAAGLVLTVLGSMLDAWVLMVEILR